MKNLKKMKNLSKIFKLYPEIKLVYLFGSRANGKIGPLSDYDFGIYLDEKDPKKRFDLRLELLGKITTKLKTDDLDLCVINDIDSPELKYNIIKDGILIFEKEPFKVLVEPKILNDYFDFYALLSRHNLTKA